MFKARSDNCKAKKAINGLKSNPADGGIILRNTDTVDS